MTITEVKIRKTHTGQPMRATASITINGDFAVHDIKVIKGKERLFVAMPSRRDEEGKFRDICHPITHGARQKIEDTVLKAYLAKVVEEAQEGRDQACT